MSKRTGDGLSLAEEISAQTSAIVLALTNPREARQAGIQERFNSIGRAEKTTRYSVDQLETSADLWPQTQLQYPCLSAAGVTIAIDIPLLSPVSEFLTILKRNLGCRMIRAFKNTKSTGTGNKSYWFYRLLDDDGDDVFSIALPNGVAGNTTVTELDVGGMVDSIEDLDTVITTDRGMLSGAFGNVDVASHAIVNTWEVNRCRPHGPKMAQFRSQHYGKNYVHADPAANQTGKLLYSLNGDPADEGVVPLIAEEGANLTGSFTWFIKSPPITTAAAGEAVLNFTINLYGYNQCQEYLVYSSQGVLTGADCIANHSFAQMVIPYTDKYRFTISIQSVTNKCNNDFMTIGCFYIGTGEAWSQLPTIDVLGGPIFDIDESNPLGTAMLAKNGSPDMYLGGFQIGGQPTKGTHWEDIVNGGSPFKAISDICRDDKPMIFKKGGYCYLRPTSLDYFELAEEVIQVTDINRSGATFPILTVPLENEPFYAHCIQNAALTTYVPAPGTQVPLINVLFDYDQSGEYTTPNKWRDGVTSTYRKEAWSAALEVMKALPQLTENDVHDWMTLFNAIGGAASSAGAALARKFPALAPAVSAVQKWGGRIMRVAGDVAPVVAAAAPLLAAL